MEATLTRAAVVGAPSAEPLTTVEARKQCDIPHADTSHDAFLNTLIIAARQKWERDTDQVCITSTVTEKLDTWPCEMLRLTRRPVQSVTSVYYRDTNGTSTLWASSNYALDTYGSYAHIIPAYNVSWPSTQGHWGDITITYVAGYSGAANVPQVWKQAMLLLVSHWFEHRSAVNFGGVTTEVPQAYEALALAWQRASYP